MKKLVAIFALTAFLLQTFSQVVIIAQYYANQDYIAKNLCENRNKPQMHCNGKCCLKKKLEREGKEQAPSPRSQKSEQVVLFCSDNRLDFNYFIPLKVVATYVSYNDLHTASVAHAVFHPPTA